MNLILITKDEKEQGLCHKDARYQHIEMILKKDTGSRLLIGLLNQPYIWEVTINKMPNKILFDKWQVKSIASPPCSLTLILALSRPIVMKRLLKDISTLGIRAIHLVRSSLGEKSYLHSSLWKGEHFEMLKKGAMQAKNTYIPDLFLHKNLAVALSCLKTENFSHKWLLHPQKEAPHLLKQVITPQANLAVAIGCERGWTDQEIYSFHQEKFQTLSMGVRILRTETATIASLYHLCEQLRMN